MCCIALAVGYTVPQCWSPLYISFQIHLRLQVFFFFFLQSATTYISMKRDDQQDATIRCLLLTTSFSTCFGHHYAHLQENKCLVTAFGVLFWFCWTWLVAVVGRCLAGCEHYEGFCSTDARNVLRLKLIINI